ncbi:vitamin B12-dependent ribonucleotide reductase [Desulfatitalea tepidiphila]|uniref:vitamin B12-dependent ribonucleotide reductase n=1 Tax=Desulfatitalea tepidiphila TaxID=1185843 RepID=UPI000A5EFCAD|nr:vitamin B12-dependent ribonucleotide reductase [Desulfatitalea tepidiphila]
MMKITFSPNARLVLEKRYLDKDPSGKIIETPEEMMRRVARHVAEGDRAFESSEVVTQSEASFFDLLSKLWFVPNSPTLMNAGRRLGQLAACFVLPVGDSIESIFDAVKHTAIIHKSGGGTGFSFSHIRPANDTVSSTAGVSSGPLSFINIFDTATEAVKQGGTRRGANMGVLRVDHPDIESFIAAKDHPGQLTNFNLSVAITQTFLDALASGQEYQLLSPRTGKTVRSVSAQKIFDRIVQSAWGSGEPGVIFIDRINQDNVTPHLGAIDATNPCGEQPLLPYESCTLGAINLSKMVSSKGVMFNRLKRSVQLAVHFLDNVVEVNQYPLPEIEKATQLTRKIGLGVMGFADLLIKLSIPYDSDEAVDQAETIMAFIHREARRASEDLGRRRGNFPAFKGSVLEGRYASMRNATVTTIAPTGTISLIAAASSGIEPLFAVAHSRHVLDDQVLSEMHPMFVQIAKKEGFFSEALVQSVAASGSVQGNPSVPEKVQRIFRTAYDIAPQSHVNIQAAFQKHTDNAVSKTVNFPAHATPEEVAQVFLNAAKMGCKGITIYRDGSRQHQVLSAGHSRAENDRIAPRPRPQRTFGLTERISTGCGKLYVTINSDDLGMCEVFAQMGKTGGCASSQIEAAGRLISLALRSGVKPEAIIKQLSGIRCPSPIWQNGKMVLSCPDAMAQVLQHVTASEPAESHQPAGMCPDCGSPLVHGEGCLNCPVCGYSKCA